MTFPRTLVALLAVACITIGAGSGVAAAGSSSGDNYRAYALIRQNLIACSLDRTWNHLGSTRRKQCTKLRKLYTLWASPGESNGYHVHCRTRKCPPTPFGEPNARSPIPKGANVFR